MFLYLSLGTWADTCVFWPAFGSNYSNALVLQEHCIQCHHGKETAHYASTCDNLWKHVKNFETVGQHLTALALDKIWKSLTPDSSTGSLCFSLACIWSFLVSIGETMISNGSFLSWIFSIFLYSSLLVSKRLFEAFWVANNLYIINSITRTIFKHVIYHK